MGSINRLPQGATVLESFSGKVNKPDAWTHGKTVAMTRYAAYCSKGYKSNYEAVPTEFLVIRISGEKTRCSSYSGKRIGQAAEILAGWKKDLEPFLTAESEVIS